MWTSHPQVCWSASAGIPSFSPRFAVVDSPFCKQGVCPAPGTYHFGPAAVEQLVVADPRPACAPTQQSGVGHCQDPRCRAFGGDGLSTARGWGSCLSLGLALFGVGGIRALPWGESCAASIRPRRRSRLGANALATPRCDGWNAAAALE